MRTKFQAEWVNAYLGSSEQRACDSLEEALQWLLTCGWLNDCVWSIVWTSADGRPCILSTNLGRADGDRNPDGSVKYATGPGFAVGEKQVGILPLYTFREAVWDLAERQLKMFEERLLQELERHVKTVPDPTRITTDAVVTLVKDVAAKLKAS
jgi:hypothetical protein